MQFGINFVAPFVLLLTARGLDGKLNDFGSDFHSAAFGFIDDSDVAKCFKKAKRRVLIQTLVVLLADLLYLWWGLLLFVPRYNSGGLNVLVSLQII